MWGEAAAVADYQSAKLSAKIEAVSGSPHYGAHGASVAAYTDIIEFSNFANTPEYINLHFALDGNLALAANPGVAFAANAEVGVSCISGFNDFESVDGILVGFNFFDHSNHVMGLSYIYSASGNGIVEQINSYPQLLNPGLVSTRYVDVNPPPTTGYEIGIIQEFQFRVNRAYNRLEKYVYPFTVYLAASAGVYNADAFSDFSHTMYMTGISESSGTLYSVADYTLDSGFVPIPEPSHLTCLIAALPILSLIAYRFSKRVRSR